MKTEFRKGIELIRMAVRLFDGCNETFNERFATTELILIADAYQRCGWDVRPDVWEEQQIAQALRGIVPQFEETESRIRAVYTNTRKRA